MSAHRYGLLSSASPFLALYVDFLKSCSFSSSVAFSLCLLLSCQVSWITVKLEAQVWVFRERRWDAHLS